MKKILAILVTAVLLLSMALPVLAEVNVKGINPGDTLYVIGDAKLNVREKSNSSAKILYRLPVNSPVTVLDQYANGYLLVEFKFQGKFADGYVSTKYLSTKVPARINNEGAILVDAETPAEPAKKDEGEKVSDMNFSYFKLIANGMKLIVAAKPSRAGGWVNLRWAPSTEAQIISKVVLNEQLTVIAEGKNWYQVQNADGYVGFIKKEFTAVVYYGIDNMGDGLGAANPTNP